MRLTKRLKRGLTLFLTRTMNSLLNCLPRKAALFVGATLGLMAWGLLPKERYKIVRHLSLVYGDEMSYREKERTAQRFFVGSGKSLVEVLRFRRHYNSEIRELIEVEGLEHLDRAYKAGKGVIGFTGHLGNFELLAVHVAGLGYKTAVIGREMYDRRLDKMLVENREALGVHNISTTDSARKILTWLKNGGVLGVLIDIDSIRIRSTFVPVFGRLALTPIGQTNIGLRAGSAFVPCACLRTERDRYRLIFRPEVKIERSDNFDADVDRMTAACTAVLEEIIDQYRDQWIWMKNRWLTSPRNSA